MEKGKKHPEMKTREKLLTAQQKETMGNCPNNVQFRKKKVFRQAKHLLLQHCGDVIILHVQHGS